MEQYAPNHPPPESRLPMGVYGGVIFAVGFFWFGWTSFPSVSYWAPLLSGLAFGVSLMFLFVSFLPSLPAINTNLTICAFLFLFDLLAITPELHHRHLFARSSVSFIRQHDRALHIRRHFPTLRQTDVRCSQPALGQYLVGACGSRYDPHPSPLH